MAASTGRHDIEVLKRDYPLARIVAMSGVRLTRTGSSSLKGCCPFHDDRRPSLLVDERDQHYHCFACGAHGDVIDWVMRREQLGFAAACQLLAGFPPWPPSAPAAARKVERGRRWDRLALPEQVVMNVAGAVYHDALWREPRALAYLHERGILRWVIRRCWLGYADGEALARFLRPRDDLRVAEELGLPRRSGGNDADEPPRDVLAGRIVVPELRGGQAIWFIGRALDDGPDRPKYLSLGGEWPVLGLERAAGRREAVLCGRAWFFRLLGAARPAARKEAVHGQSD